MAREAGVSKASVSFAFNSPERLSEGTANRIRHVADQLGYTPHPVARMLSSGRTTTIGILSPQSLSHAFANPFFPLFAEGVATVAEERGFALLFISPLHGSLGRAMHRATVDGLLVVGLQETHPEVAAIRRATLPCVVVDAPGWPEHAAIEVDDEGGARAAAAHLVSLGHREFLVLAIEPPSRSSEDSVEGVSASRLRGYRAALEDAALALPASTIRVTPATLEGGEDAFGQAWSEGCRPTAVLAMSDAAAAGVLLAARRLGLRVPADLSIVGFDDLPITRFTDPPLTTVHQPVREKGEEAARLLLTALAAGGDGERHHRVMETRLVLRGSTARPSGGQEVMTGG